MLGWTLAFRFRRGTESDRETAKACSLFATNTCILAKPCRTQMTLNLKQTFKFKAAPPPSFVICSPPFVFHFRAAAPNIFLRVTTGGKRLGRTCFWKCDKIKQQLWELRDCVSRRVNEAASICVLAQLHRYFSFLFSFVFFFLPKPLRCLSAPPSVQRVFSTRLRGFL